METIISSVQQQQQQQRTTPKRSKKTKKKNKPIKVVYISNPMKVNTTASDFRALVQELTGQYAQSPPDPSRFREYAGGDDGGAGNLMDSDHHALLVPPPPPVLLDDGGFSSFENLEPFDDDVFSFTPHHQMVENVSAATVFYESPLLQGHHW